MIKVSELAKNAKYPDDNDLCIDDWDTCSCVYREEKNFDAEKGFIDYEIIVLRFIDNKFYKFSYTQFGHNGNDILNQTAVEVQPKNKTITYYE